MKNKKRKGIAVDPKFMQSSMKSNKDLPFELTRFPCRDGSEINNENQEEQLSKTFENAKKKLKYMVGYLIFY